MNINCWVFVTLGRALHMYIGREGNVLTVAEKLQVALGRPQYKYKLARSNAG